jgi:predicted MFS family arabinose efflux permease
VSRSGREKSAPHAGPAAAAGAAPAAPAAPAALVPRRPLAVRDFRLLVAGQFVSLVGDQCFLVALPFVVLAGGRSASALGALLAVVGGGRAMASLLGGVAGDRFPRRAVMLGSDLARLALTGVFGVLVLAGRPSWWLIAALTGLLALAEGVFLPSSYSIVPDLVPERMVVAANSVTAAQVQVAALIGPALGGVLVAAASTGDALLVDAGTFAVSAAALVAIRHGRAIPVRDDPAGAGAGGAGGAGERPTYRAFLHFLAGSRLLQFSVLSTVIVNLGYLGAVQVALPVLAHRRFSNGPGAYGLLLAGSGAGALAGALLAGRVLRGPRPAVVALAAGLMEGTATLLVPTLPGVFPGIVGPLLPLAVAGAAGAVVNVFFVSALQHYIPDQYLSRTMSVLMLAAYTSAPASAVLAGFLVDGLSPTAAFWLGGAATLAAFAVGLASADMRGLALPSGR